MTFRGDTKVVCQWPGGMSTSCFEVRFHENKYRLFTGPGSVVTGEEHQFKFKKKNRRISYDQLNVSQKQNKREKILVYVFCVINLLMPSG
jgi:hypothetical protein